MKVESTITTVGNTPKTTSPHSLLQCITITPKVFCTPLGTGGASFHLLDTPILRQRGYLIFDDDVYYYNCQRLKLEGETENMCVWTKKRGSMKAVVPFYLVTTRLNQCRESSNKWTMPSLQLMMMTFITISARD